nr:uncharacterized protein LOC131770104 [Pocillopora verrucosa]
MITKRKGSKREAIVSEVVEKKIKLCPPDLYKSLMEGKKDLKEVENLKAVYFCRHLRDHRLSVFTNIEDMPDNLKKKREELWQLDEGSPFPDEVEIIVPEDRPYKGCIRPKENLNTPFTKDNIIEMLKCLPWKKYTQ